MTQQDLFPKIRSKPKKTKKDAVSGEWKVPSFTSDKEYLVRQEGKKWMCDCTYFQSKKRQCKHIQWKKQQLGLIKEDLSGFKSGIQKAIRRGDLGLLRLCFDTLWMKDKRWLLWRSIVLAAEESENWVGRVGTICFQKNSEREDVWRVLGSMAVSSKSKEAEGLRVASHIITEEDWNAEDFVSGDRLFQLKAWIDVQSRFQNAGKDKKAFWRWFGDRFQVTEGYPQETVTTCKERSGIGGMAGDIELMITVSFLASTTEWVEPQTLEVPREQDIEPLQSLPWWCLDQHTRIGKIVSWKLRQTIQDKQEWKYVADDLWFNMESARCNELAHGSFWWPLMLSMLWKKHGRTTDQAEKDWETWGPRIRALVEKSMGNQGARKG